METAKLKKFAQSARRTLIEQVSSKLQQVLADGSAARRENKDAIKKLEEEIRQHDQDHVIDRVAYIWFNRFCALRFMDVNRYTTMGIVSPAEEQIQPEILAEAKMGHIDEEMIGDKARQKIFDLLDGRAPSPDPQNEAYRMLLVEVCNYWHRAMPFLFQSIDDYTELLMPGDLLSSSSILAYTREAMTPDACQDVEVIGWLYQFYISEKKDEVFEGLRNNKKIEPEDIPAATQLFTPHWIVRYLVENSLGRLWMLNRPNSRLIKQMDYYIKSEQHEKGFLRINKPEDIKVCDPACGSGHMLTYAFDLLYTIYEEEGVDPKEIPGKILSHNLYGIEIDERAGALAAFALTIKARAKQRRFFRRPILPNICVLNNIYFDENELKEYMGFIGVDLFTLPLRSTLRQFEAAKNFGSLIQPEASDAAGILNDLKTKNISEQLLLFHPHQKVLQILKQADYLNSKYHVVITNPPYMGGKGMNKHLGSFAKDNYPESKSDLYAMFIERVLSMISKEGFVGLMTPFTWMFLKSFKGLRSTILNNCTITSLVRPEYHSFFESAYVPICSFTVHNKKAPKLDGAFIDLNDFYGSNKQPEKFLEAINNQKCNWFYKACSEDFLKIPDNPIAYWISEKVISLFEEGPFVGQIANAKQGLITGDNDRFLRFWQEVEIDNIDFCIKSRSEAISSLKRWFPHHKGGAFRKWYGNHEYVVDWENDGEKIRNFFDKNGKLRSRPQNLDYYFKPAGTWTSLTVGSFNCRLSHGGFIYDAKGPMIAPINQDHLFAIVGMLNCKVSNYLLKLLAPTMDYNQGPVSNLPWPTNISQQLSAINKTIELLEKISKTDWDAYETSWDFTSLPLLRTENQQSTLQATYQRLRKYWLEMTQDAQRLEEENNRVFIENYGLQNEMTPEVPLNEITLTCNPYYRYSDDKSDEELEALLISDTMRELISYAVGCMFGRYALEKPGLIMANLGETLKDYLQQIPDPIFPADDDNVIPMLDGDWFTDDIVGRFYDFLRVTFGEEHYEDNLKFITKAIGKDIRKYFLKDFYNDHIKRYKKRPIYWMFSSPKGSFNALIYMHRYRPDTVSVVLNGYLREFRTKLASRKNHLEAVSSNPSSTQTEKTKALRELDKTNKMITEMEEYEREILYPLATEQVELDLDDGVKMNYPRLGKALKKIPGL